MGDGKAGRTQRRRPRQATLWRAAVAVVLFVAFGCGQGSERTAEVVGRAPAGTGIAQPALERTPDIPVPAAQPGIGGATGSSGQSPGPGGDTPGPGDGPDGPTGPVGDTGGDSGDGAGVVPGEGDRSGGLRLLAPPPPYLGLANELFDLCDDAEAYTVVFARPLGPGEEMTDEDREAIAFKRRVAEVSCSEAGGRRYVYMSEVGPSGAFATEQAAVEDYNDRSVGYPESKITHPKDIPLGYFGHLDWDFPLEDFDEVAVVDGSVLVRDGVVRGLVRNLSKTLFAREVTVTARPTEGSNNDAQPVSGRFPLTVQPGERAPFEIEGWTGSENPEMIDLSVSAKLSTRVDITRSFSFGTGGTVTARAVDEEFFKNFVPDFVYQAEKHKIGDDGRLMIEYISASLTAPTSHPSLKDQVLNQNIKDLRVYMALIGNGQVHDIIEPPLHVRASSAGHPHRYPQVISLPTIYGGAPFYGFAIVFIPEYSWHIWTGEPGPLDYNPRTIPETPPPTVDPDYNPPEPQPPTE
ncbi:hypothetical protein [Candidatus Poriferisocius sp.]|uniref:hypothetical protein n=1 Tax=Candidatus Poriferisocius sp. TaxID=3101276 RepID=UPI003B5BC9C0